MREEKNINITERKHILALQNSENIEKSCEEAESDSQR